MEDADLLEPEDLRFDGIPPWERERFDDTYPRRVNLSDLKLRIHYKVPVQELLLLKSTQFVLYKRPWTALK